MTSARRRWARAGVAGMAASACLLAIPAFAAAEVRSGSGTDPVGDWPGAAPHEDLTAAEVTYDTAGTVNAKLTMAAAPGAANPALAWVILGRLINGQCERVLWVTTNVPSGPAAMYDFAGGTYNPPTASLSGNVATIQATDPRIGNAPLDCAIALGGRSPDAPGDDLPNIRLTATTPPAPPQPAPTPPSAPSLTAASLRPATFAAARRGAPFTRRGRARLTFTLSAASTVNVLLERRSGRRWRALRGSHQFNLQAGRNTLRFTGRWRGKRLARGRYRFLLSATAAGATGQLVRVPFRIR